MLRERPGAFPARPERGNAMKRLALILPLVALAACGSDPEVKADNAKPSEGATKMREAAGKGSFVRPGKWEQTVSLLKMEAPGMPPEARQYMQRAMDKVQVHSVCLSKEQAEKPREDFFTGADKNCTYEHFNWGDGKIDLKLICKHQQATTTMAMAGTYTPDNYVLTMTSTNNAAGAAGDMVMTMKVDAKRVGDCDGKEQAQVGN
jgi:predicted small lipoprotein YifL